MSQGRGYAYSLKGECSSAIEDMETMLRINPNNPEAPEVRENIKMIRKMQEIGT